MVYSPDWAVNQVENNRDKYDGAAGDAAEKAPKFRPLQQEITDIPNVITLIRIGMIPFILIWIQNYSPGLSALSAFIFLVAALTDALDGYLARRLGLVTVVGKFLDPLADKLIVLSALVMLVAKGRAPAWLVIILMARELAVTGLRAIASQQGFVIAAGSGGKAKSALQMVGITFLLVHFPYKLLFFTYDFDFHRIGTYLLYLSLVVSVFSAAQYFTFFAEAAQKQSDMQAAMGITRKVVRERLQTQRVRKRGKRNAKRKLRQERLQARRSRRQKQRDKS